MIFRVRNILLLLKIKPNFKGETYFIMWENLSGTKLKMNHVSVFIFTCGGIIWRHTYTARNIRLPVFVFSPK